MKPDELLNIIYRFYPRGIDAEGPGWRDAPEHRRLEAAARAAGSAKRVWNAMISRIQARFPNCTVFSHPDELLGGARVACYSGTLFLPKTQSGNDDRITFMVSFLAPFYVLCSFRAFPTAANRPPETRLSPSDGERPYWEAIAKEIEATYEASPMPAEIGHIIVPDVQPGNRTMGEAMIYDCFFDDHPRLIDRDDHVGLLLQKAYEEYTRGKKD